MKRISIVLTVGVIWGAWASAAAPVSAAAPSADATPASSIARLRAAAALARAGLARIVLETQTAAGPVSTGPWTSLAVRRSAGAVFQQPIATPPFDSPGEAEIKLTGPMTASRRQMMAWVNQSASGKREPVSATIHFIPVLPMPIRPISFDLGKSMPIGYQPPTVSAGNYDMLEESLTFHVEEVKPTKGSKPRNAGNNAPEASQATALPTDDYLFGGKFRVSIDGIDQQAIAFSGGGMRIELNNQPSSTPQGNCRQYTPMTVNWSNIVVTKIVRTGDTRWQDWYQKTASGDRQTSNVSLSYLDSADQSARAANFHNAWPIRYDVINTDARAGSDSVREVMELVVECAEYR